MGKFSIHVQHYKATQLAGIDRHNRRLGQNHRNQQIDSTRTSNNITLKAVERSLYQDAKKLIEEEVLSKGHRVTKSSIWVTEICCTLPEGIEPERSEEYFRAIMEYFEKSGISIISQILHMDETTTHMHMDTIPLTEDGHLSRKRIWTRARLLQIHDELPKYLQERGFDVERGDHLEDFQSKDKAGMSMHKYKIYKEREKLKQQYNSLVTEYNELADKYNHVAKEQVELKRGNLRTAQNLIAQSRGISR